METSLVWSFGSNTCQIHIRFHIAYNISNHLQYIQSSCICTWYRFYQVFAINQWLTSKIGSNKDTHHSPWCFKVYWSHRSFPTSYSCRAILAQQNQTSRTHWRIGATNLAMTRNITTRLMSFFDNQHIGEIAFCEKLIHWSFFEASFFDKNHFLISRIETHEASQQLLLLFNSQLCTNISSFQSATRATSVYAWHGAM